MKSNWKINNKNNYQILFFFSELSDEKKNFKLLFTIN